MLRELRQQSHERIRNGLVGSIGHRAYDVEHRVHREAVRRINGELEALGVVAAHVDEPPQRARLERTHELRCAPPQGDRFRAARGLQLIRDLQQVPDDHLIVPRALRMLVDRLGDEARLGGRRRTVIPRPPRPSLDRLGRQRRARQPDPQLRAAERPVLVALVVGWRRLIILLQQLETLVGDWVQADVLPRA